MPVAVGKGERIQQIVTRVVSSHTDIQIPAQLASDGCAPILRLNCSNQTATRTDSVRNLGSETYVLPLPQEAAAGCRRPGALGDNSCTARVGILRTSEQ